MKRSIQVFLILSSVLILGLLGQPASTTFEVSGHITDHDTGIHVEGADVRILDAATGVVLGQGVSDTDGRYEIAVHVAVESGSTIPRSYSVEPVYPNPVTASDALVRIEYRASQAQREEPDILLYDALGHHVRPGSRLAAGAYYVRLRFADGTLGDVRSLVMAESGVPRFEAVHSDFEMFRAAKRGVAGDSGSIEIICIVTKVGYATHESRAVLTESMPNTLDFEVSVSDEPLVFGESRVVAESDIGAAGGSIVVDAPETPIDGMSLDVPVGAWPDARPVRISYADMVGHRLPEGVHIASAVIGVETEAGYADEVLSITIPVDVPDGHFAMAFFYDETNGQFEGLPLLEAGEGYLTVWTRHFDGSSPNDDQGKSGIGSIAHMVVVSVKESELSGQQIIDTGFRPGVDDWEFVNRGSYIAPSGHCAGQSMTAMWYYYEKKLTGAPALNGLYDDVNSSKYVLWQDNPLGYRFASVVQADMQWDGWIRTRLIPLGDPENHEMSWKAFALSMLMTGEPQYVKLSRLDTSDPQDPRWLGHAIIAYKVSLSEGKLFVADPNYPGEERTISYQNGAFVPYGTKQNDQEANNKAYTHIGYLSKTSMADWDVIGERWKEFEAGTIGSVAPNALPDYSLLRVVNGTREPLPDAFDTQVDSVVIEAKCPTCSGQIPGTDRLQIFYVYDADGNQLAVSNSASKGQAVVKLKPGQNRLGLYVTGAASTSGGVRAEFLDYRWITAYLQSPMVIYPDLFAGEWAPIFNYGTPGQVYMLQAIHFGTAPPDGVFTWDFGDGSEPVDVVGDSTVTHSFDEVGEYTVSMTLSDPGGAVLGAATGTASIALFHGRFRTTRFEMTESTGSFDEPSVARTANTLATMSTDPASLVLDFARFEDGEIGAYLYFEPPGGESEILRIADNGDDSASDLDSDITISADIFSGRYVSGSVGAENLAFRWIDTLMTQDGPTIIGTLTLYGRRYLAGDGESIVLQSEGAVTYEFSAESFSPSFE